MDAESKLVDAAERLFYRHGYTATGMDRLIRAAGMSSRTVYKQAGSKAALMAAVLAERERRFLRHCDVETVDALFVALEDWLRTEGPRGCLFLRAYAETGGDTPEIAEALRAHKARLGERIGALVAAEVGLDPASAGRTADQLLVLFEGATAAAVYRGPEVVTAARAAAAALLAQARA